MKNLNPFTSFLLKLILTLAVPGSTPFFGLQSASAQPDLEIVQVEAVSKFKVRVYASNIGDPLNGHDIYVYIDNDFSAQLLPSDLESIEAGEAFLVPIPFFLSGLSVGVQYTFELRTFNQGTQVDSESENFQPTNLLTMNKVQSITLLEPISSDLDLPQATAKIISQTYADGLGRPVQTNAQQQSPQGHDLITYMEYDDLGRQTTSYLPYTQVNTATGEYRPAAKSEQSSFYAGGVTGLDDGSEPQAKTGLETSPLSRTLEQGAPGTQWQLNNNTVENDYRSNLSIDGVQLWDVAGNTISRIGTYPDGVLLATETRDENGNISLEFKDKAEKVILKKARKDDSPETWVETYYVYDKFNNLRLIIPPEAVRELRLPGNNWNPAALAENSSKSIQDLWCTYFEYDGLNRLVSKKIPEADAIYTVYDALGRAVLTQDGNLRASNKWLFSKYDIQGRAVMTGIYQNNSATTRTAMQTLAESSPLLYENRSGNPFDNADHGYTHNNAFPAQTGADDYEVLSVTYYDDYDFLGSNSNYDYTAQLADGSTQNPNQYFDRVRNQVTGSKVNYELFANLFLASNVTYDSHPQEAGSYYYKGNNITLAPGFETAPGQTVIIGNDIAVNAEKVVQWQLAVSYYNQYGNVIETVSDNHLGGMDISSSKYNFAGWVLETLVQHTTSGDAIYIKQKLDYDPTGRLLTVKQSLGQTLQEVAGEPTLILLSNTYNELGQLIQKRLHSTDGGANFAQSVDYTYNIRGWLRKMNDVNNLGNDLFAYELKYNEYDANDTIGSEQPQYNGNISAMTWRAAGDNQVRGYGYNYDQLNQLAYASYAARSGSAWNQEIGRYNVSNLYYDLNGNIQSVNREGETLQNQYGAVDALTYHYAGNKLIAVNDLVTADYDYDFLDNGSNLQSGEYTYDANGNMITDLNKGITVTYDNHLNLPTEVVFSATGNRINWTYTSTGSKLRKEVYYASAGNTVITDYVNGFVYEDGALDFFQHDEGRVLADGQGGLTYEYYLKDHLGNTRVTFDESGNIKEESHYYPFGMRVRGVGTTGSQVGTGNRFLYNGKELEGEDIGLNWYHYGARFYDPQLGKWHTVDPADELSSPYNYVANNPANNFDPDGRAIKYKGQFIDGLQASELLEITLVDGLKAWASAGEEQYIEKTLKVPFEWVSGTVAANWADLKDTIGGGNTYTGPAHGSNTIDIGRFAPVVNQRVDGLKIAPLINRRWSVSRTSISEPIADFFIETLGLNDDGQVVIGVVARTITSWTKSIGPLGEVEIPNKSDVFKMVTTLDEFRTLIDENDIDLTIEGDINDFYLKPLEKD